MEIVRCSSDVFFVRWSGCEIASPVGIWTVGVREHVVVLGWPLDVEFANGVDVVAWRRVSEVVLVSVVGVHVLNHGIHGSVIVLCSHVLEVLSKENKNLVCRVVVSSCIQILH